MALCLNLKIGETIFIGNEITIKIQELNGSQRVKLIIEAPKCLNIIRSDAKVKTFTDDFHPLQLEKTQEKT